MSLPFDALPAFVLSSCRRKDPPMRMRSRSRLAAGAEVRIARRIDRSRVPNHHEATIQTSAGGTSGRTYGPSRALRHRRPPIPHKPRATSAPYTGYPHADLVGRDYALQDVLDRIAAGLKAVEHIKTPEHDDRVVPDRSRGGTVRAGLVPRDPTSGRLADRKAAATESGAMKPALRTTLPSRTRVSAELWATRGPPSLRDHDSLDWFRLGQGVGSGSSPKRI